MCHQPCCGWWKMHEDSYHHPVKDRSSNILVSGPELVLLVASCSIVAPAFLHLDSLLKSHHPEKGLHDHGRNSKHPRTGPKRLCFILGHLRLVWSDYFTIYTYLSTSLRSQLMIPMALWLQYVRSLWIQSSPGSMPIFISISDIIPIFVASIATSNCLVIWWQNHHTFPKPSDPSDHGSAGQVIQDQVNSVQSQLHWEAPTWAGNGFKFQGAAVDFCGIRDCYSNDDYIYPLFI